MALAGAVMPQVAHADTRQRLMPLLLPPNTAFGRRFARLHTLGAF